jgi:hypothetical protein
VWIWKAGGIVKINFGNSSGMKAELSMESRMFGIWGRGYSGGGVVVLIDLWRVRVMSRKYPKVTKPLKEAMDADYLKSSFSYRDGRLYWKESKRGVNGGEEAGSMGVNGRWFVCVCGHSIRRARIIWIMHHGKLASNLYVMNRNGDKLDDRIENLIICNKYQISLTDKLSRNNTTGHTGVSYVRRLNKYKAVLRLYGKDNYLGLFDTVEAASEAYRRAKVMHLGLMN